MEASGMDAVLLLMGEAGLGGVTKVRAAIEQFGLRSGQVACKGAP